MRWLERYLVEGSLRLQHFAEIIASLANRDEADNGKEWEAEVGEPHPYGHPTTREYVPTTTTPKPVSGWSRSSRPMAVTTSSACTIGGRPRRTDPRRSEPRKVIYFDDYAPDR